MNRNQFLSLLKSDIEGLDKNSKLDNSRVLLEKEPDAFDYFISLYAKAFPKGKLLENYEPKSLILNSDLVFFKMELGLIDNYSYNLAYKDFFHIQEMKYWLSCKQEVEEIELIYGEYETISEILDATGYTLSGLYREMSDIMYNVKKDYREKLRQEEIERKKKERENLENKVKNSKEETARKLAELKARREGKIVEEKVNQKKESIEEVSTQKNFLVAPKIDNSAAIEKAKSKVDKIKEEYAKKQNNSVNNEGSLSEGLSDEKIKDLQFKALYEECAYLVTGGRGFAHGLDYFIYVADTLSDFFGDYYGETEEDFAKLLRYWKEMGLTDAEIKEKFELVANLELKINKFSDSVYKLCNKVQRG